MRDHAHQGARPGTCAEGRAQAITKFCRGCLARRRLNWFMCSRSAPRPGRDTAQLTRIRRSLNLTEADALPGGRRGEEAHEGLERHSPDSGPPVRPAQSCCSGGAAEVIVIAELDTLNSAAWPARRFRRQEPDLTQHPSAPPSSPNVAELSRRPAGNLGAQEGVEELCLLLQLLTSPTRTENLPVSHRPAPSIIRSFGRPT